MSLSQELVGIAPWVRGPQLRETIPGDNSHGVPVWIHAQHRPAEAGNMLASQISAGQRVRQRATETRLWSAGLTTADEGGRRCWDSTNACA